MPKKTSLGDFNSILAYAKAVQAATNEVPNPFVLAPDLEVFKQAVASGKRILPQRYQTRYVAVLEEIIKQAEYALSRVEPDDHYGREEVLEQLRAVFSILAAPIVQLRSSKYERELKAFLAEVSNIYRRFINDDQVSKGTSVSILSPDLDPLASFGNDAAGPFTIAASASMPVAIVSKPANQMNFLPLWAADGHEVGGHDIYGAVAGFESDLKHALETNLRKAIRSGRIRFSRRTVKVPTARILWWNWYSKVSMEDFMVAVWKSWLSEASADQAGLLNLGPMYLDSLMLTIASLRPHHRLTTSSLYDRHVFARTSGFAEHPIDVVRVLLGIEAIKRLKFGCGDSYAALLAERLEEIQGGQLPSQLSWLDRSGQPLIQIPLTDFKAVLPVVCETILDAALPALHNQSLAEIINWLDSDEAEVLELSELLQAGATTFGGHAEARHVVAASMLAVEKASAGTGTFVEDCRRIHDTGISMLVEMYDEVCVLCSIHDPLDRPTPRVDLNKILLQIKGH